MRRETPLTAGERRGLIAVAVIALTVVCLTLWSRMRYSDTPGSAGEVRATAAAAAVSVTPDSVAAPVVKERGNKKKTDRKRNKKPKAPARVPAERSFLDEK